jgi:hypothetical protein
MPPAVVELITQFSNFNYLFVFSNFFKIFISQDTVPPDDANILGIRGRLVGHRPGTEQVDIPGIGFLPHWLPFPELSVNKIYTEGNYLKAQELQKQNPSVFELWIRLSFFSRIF